MMYHKGKIRNISFCNLLLKKATGQIRYNSCICNETGNAIQDTKSPPIEKTFAAKAISFAQIPKNVQEELNTLVGGDFTPFQQLTKPRITNQRVLRKQVEYTTIPELNELVNQNKVKNAIRLIEGKHKRGICLTLLELQSLFVQFLPFSWYAYRLLKVYETELDLNLINSKVLVLVMKVTYSNFDFKLFDRAFQLFQLKSDKIPHEILMSAIQVYLKTENIHIATQLFNQQVMTEKELPNRILDLFISNLYNQTKNINLCFTSYKFWLSRNLNTNISIDSFMYNLLLECGSIEDITWIEQSLRERNLKDKFAIQFGNVCNDLSKNFEKYHRFINSSEVEKFRKLAEKDKELSLMSNNLTYLHLRHKNYKLALNTFQNVSNRKDFELTIFSILRHFEKEQRPEIIYSILENLRTGSNYQIHWSHILIYWRSLIKKYPQLGFEIQKKFKKCLKKSVYHKFSFLSKMLLINKISSNAATLEMRFYPIVKYDNLKYDLKPLSVAPKLKNIESRLFSGILPNSELLRKSIKLTKDKHEFSRFIEIVNDLNMKNSNISNTQIRNMKLNIEIFYKECSFGNKLSMRDFINKQLEIIDKKQFTDDTDLCSLFKICVKCNYYDEAIRILELFDIYNIKITGDQQILGFFSMFIKWCWSTKNFKDLVVVLDWLKNQDEIVFDRYFWANLNTAAFKNLRNLKNELLTNDELNLSELELLEKESEKKYLEKVLPKIMNYYDFTLERIKGRNINDSKRIIEESSRRFKKLIEWVDEDTRTLFESD